MVGILVASIAYLSFTTEYTALPLLLVTKVLGVFITSQLFYEKYSGQGSFLSNVCTLGKNSNCNKVICSPASQFIGLFDFTELGIFYFSGGLMLILFQIFTGFQPFIIQTLLFLNGLTIFYSLYSVFYQKFIARSWCPLCLIVQGIFLLELVVLYFLYPNWPFQVDITSVILILICFFTPYLIWEFMIKSVLMKYFRFDTILQRYQKLKQNKNIFRYILSNSEELKSELNFNYAFSTKTQKDINNELVCFLSPSCKPCKSQYLVIKRLFAARKIRVTIYLVYKDQDDKNIVRDLLGSSSRDFDILDNWFLKGKLPINPKQNDLEFNNYCLWFESLNIKSFPQFYFNRKLLSNEYSLYDLHRLLN